MGISETRSPHSSPERTSPRPERRVGVSPQSSDGGYARRDNAEPPVVVGGEGTANLEAALAQGMKNDRR